MPASIRSWTSQTWEALPQKAARAFTMRRASSSEIIEHEPSADHHWTRPVAALPVSEEASHCHAAGANMAGLRAGRGGRGVFMRINLRRYVR